MATETASNEEKNANEVSGDLAQKIIKQIEFYFGEINLSKDRFMQEELKKDAGWVQIDTLTKFNRLKSLSTDANTILTALKKSESGLLEIDEENKKLKRAKPLPENSSELETTLKKNTIYFKGLPTTLKLDDLYQFFEKHGKVLQICMRRFPATKQFKGSAFVTFENNDQVQAIIDTKDFKYNDTILTIEKQEDYFKRKEVENEKINKEKEEKRNKRENEENARLEKMRPGCAIKIKGLNEECTRESLRELFDNYAKIEWVHYDRGQPEAILRLLEENSARDALEKALKENDGKLKIKEAELECVVLEGDEEKQFWLNHFKSESERRNKRKFGGGKRGGGGGGFKNKKRRSN